MAIANTHRDQQALIIAPAWLGDAVMSQALLKFLRLQQPDLTFDVAAPPACLPLFERMAEVREVIALPFQHGEWGLMKRLLIGRSLRKRHYDYAFVLPNSWKSALVPCFAGIKQRIGWRGEMRYGVLNRTRRLDKQAYPLMLQRFIALAGLSALGSGEDQAMRGEGATFLDENVHLFPAMTVTAAQQLAVCKGLGISRPTQPVFILCPGAAYGVSKRWLPEYFSALANYYLARDCLIMLLGCHEDQGAANTIMELTQNRCYNFCGRTTLAQAIDLLSLADMVVTNDSGLLHVACALDRRVVAIYGSSSPNFTPPLAQQVAVCYLNLPCSPCFARDCPLGHFHCMRQLLPEQVIDVVDQLYAKPLRNRV